MNENNPFSRINLPTLAMLALTVVAALLVIKDIVPEPRDRVVSVTATSKSLVKPDVAQLRVGVITQPQPTAAVAVTKGNEQMNKVNQALKNAGIKAEDLRSSAYNLSPRYNYDPQQGQKLDGYELNQELLVKIRDLSKVGDVLAAATGAGANQIGDIQFVVDDPDQARTVARNEAIAKAKVRARNLERVSGIRLGKLVDVVENYEGDSQPPIYYATGMGGARDAAIPEPTIEPGQTELNVSVTLVYEVR